MSRDQQEFDRNYITSVEICQTLGVHRCTVLGAVRAGKLPEPIVLRRANGGAHVLLWLRDKVTHIVSEWGATIQSRKGAE